jgi:branched-subunit amino acid aminotransferase/4-amino-4-deoxychorismate lyase
VVPTGATRPLHILATMTAELVRDPRTMANYGHFTSMRVDRGRVRGLGPHLDRLDRAGEISEGSVWNVCFPRGTAPATAWVWPSAPALPGIAMRLLSDALEAAGPPVETRPVAPADLAGFRAAFASNALAPVQVVEQIDDMRLAGDEEFRRLVELYEQIPEETV